MFGAQLERERERKMDGNLTRWGGEKEREKKKTESAKEMEEEMNQQRAE